MKIHQITLQNYRNIAKEQFRFNPIFTVLIGENGTGKTTILDALAFAMGTFFLGVDGVSSCPIKAADKRRIFVSPNSSEIQLPFRIDVEQSLNNEEFVWFRHTKRASGGTTSYINAKNIIQKAEKLVESVRKGENVNLPLLAYYGIDRTSRLFEKAGASTAGSRLDAYKNVLDPRIMNHKASEWFRNAQLSVLQQLQNESTDQNKDLYDAFTQALASTVKDWKEVQYNITTNEVVGKLSNGSWTPLSYLSSGYKAIISLVMDIAYRAVTLNPHLGLEAVKQTAGIVLIDEIDLYLHPKWQRSIVKDLKDAFPNIQFIVTTHSPFIVQSLKANELINLDGNIATDDPINKSIEEVTEDEMGLEKVKRSEVFLDYQKVAAEYFDLIEEGKNSTSDEQIAKLKHKLDALELYFVNDAVYLALMHAERKSELGK